MNIMLRIFLLNLLIIQSFGQAFITTWKTDNPGISASNQITIPTFGSAVYSYSIYWEQVGNAAINGTISGPITGEYTITFPTAGIYRVSITGTFPRIYFNGSSNPVINNDFNKILTVEQWGSIVWTSMGNAFQACANLTIPATDAPNLTQVTDMSYMFAFATSFNQPIDHWNVSNVTDMTNLFYGADSFNQPIGAWNVSRVTSMSGMFAGATNFNQPIGSWDVGSVRDMRLMFGDSYVEGAISFNQPIGNWNVSKVLNMTNMFAFAGLGNGAPGK